MWDTKTGRLLNRLNDHRLGTGAITFSPNSKMVATASWSAIRLWDMASGHELLPNEGHMASVQFVSLSADGSTLVSGGDETVAVWNAVSGVLRYRSGDLAEGIRPLLFTTDGRTLVTESGGRQVTEETDRGSVSISNTGTSQTFWTVTNERLSFQRKRTQVEYDEEVRFSTDLRTLISWEGRGHSPGLSPLHVRDAANENSVSELKNTACRWKCVTNGETVSRVVAVSADGKLVALANRDDRSGDRETFGLWETQTGKARQLSSQRKPEKIAILCFAFSGNGAQLAAGRRDGLIERWDISSGRSLPPLKGHQGEVRALAYSPDGRSLASGGDDGTVRLWEIATSQERRRFRGHQGAVTAVAFGDGGRTVVTGGEDTTVILWAVWPSTRCVTRWSDEEQDTLWTDLGSLDAAKAFHAAQELAERPEPAANLVRERLRPIPPETNNMSWKEMVMQACGLHKKIDGVISAEQLRVLRASKALECCASSEARSVFKAAQTVQETIPR